MKKYIFIILGALFLGSCNLLWDVDTTAHISMISCKPEITLLGDPIMSLPVGGTYTEQGIEAYACDTPLTYSIVQGAVDPNKKGFYVVVYKAVNGFGWENYAYRAVLVYEGDPYMTNIEGTYGIGFKFNATITKYSIKGYWYMDNVLESTKKFPVIFAEDPNRPGVFRLVPGVHPTMGKYRGYAVFSSTKLTFKITFTDPKTGAEYEKTYIWIKKS